MNLRHPLEIQHLMDRMRRHSDSDVRRLVEYADGWRFGISTRGIDEPAGLCLPAFPSIVGAAMTLNTPFGLTVTGEFKRDDTGALYRITPVESDHALPLYRLEIR